MQKPIRVLVVEDNVERTEIIREWIPESVIPIFASSAGLAIGILQRDFGELAGLMLDHDLQERVITETDTQLSGTNVTSAIIQYLPRDVPILVHSMNPAGAQRVSQRLDAAGFWITRIPMIELTRAALVTWIEEVMDNLELE